MAGRKPTTYPWLVEVEYYTEECKIPWRELDALLQKNARKPPDGSGMLLDKVLRDLQWAYAAEASATNARFRFHELLKAYCPRFRITLEKQNVTG